MWHHEQAKATKGRVVLLQGNHELMLLDDMQAGNEKVEKELDRMLELFKKLEFKQKLQETADKLEKLAQKQEELSKQTEKNPDAKDSKQQEEAKQQQLRHHLN